MTSIKNLLLILATIGFTNMVSARSERKLDNYTHKTQISVAENKAIISVDGVQKTFATKMVNNTIQAEQPNELLAFLNLDDNHQVSLQTQYDTLNNGQFKGMHIANQIINRASALDGIDLVGSNTNALQVVDDANNGSNTVVPDSEYNEAKPEQNAILKFWPWILGVLGASVFSFFLGKSFNRQDANVIEMQEDFEPVPTITEVKNSKEKVTKKQATVKELRELDKQKTTAIKSLQTENKNVHQQLAQLTQEVKNIQTKQNATIDVIQRKLVDPYVKAVEDNDSNKILASALSGMANLTSIARDAKGAKQEYDVYNLQHLFGNTTTTNIASKEINEKTFADDIPKNLKAIIELLRKNNISSLDNTSFFGYTIKKV